MCVDQLLGFLSSVSLPHGAKALDLAVYFRGVRGFWTSYRGQQLEVSITIPTIPGPAPDILMTAHLREKVFSQYSLRGGGGEMLELDAVRAARTSRELGFTPRTTIKQ